MYLLDILMLCGVLQYYFLLLFIILLCVFVVCIFDVFVYAYVLFSVLPSQLPELNYILMMIKNFCLKFSVYTYNFGASEHKQITSRKFTIMRRAAKQECHIGRNIWKARSIKFGRTKNFQNLA